MQNTDWNRYLYELQQYIQIQDDRIRSLEEQIQKLLSNQEKTSGVTIEKVEYKFDQLKIETLSGSLHIGLSPEDLNQIEDLALGQVSNQLQPSQQSPPLDQQILTELTQWSQGFGPNMIRNLAQAHNQNIDDSHLSLLLQDIQKQFPARIKHYKEQGEKQEGIANEQQLRAFIIENIHNEVHQSLEKYIKEHEGEL